jgi:hypothetical protein
MSLFKSPWSKLITLIVSIVAVFAAGMKAGGPRSESETSETNLSIHTGIELKRKAGRQVQEGVPPPLPTPQNVSGEPQRANPVKEEKGPPYVGGNYVSGNSTIRYVLEDNNGNITMYGYDVARGQSVLVGSGRMIGRRLVIPRFYSFLDDVYGTLKLELLEDGKTLEGTFEGLNAAQQGRVVLLRLP